MRTLDSSRDVEKEVKKGRFRKDLYYLLNAIPFSVPALREHVDNIPVFSCRGLVGRSILVGIDPVPVRSKGSHKIVPGIGAFVAQRSITDFEVPYIGI